MTLEYLDHYLKIENPGYAVLVRGHWGAGKTHQIKQHIKEKNPIYVSFFGLDNINAVHMAILITQIPKTKIGNIRKKLLKLNAYIDPSGGEIQAVARILLDSVGGSLDWYNKNSIDLGRPIIFDDLERSNLPLHDRLGIINHYVEHSKSNVICIANDLMFKNKETELIKFEDYKEKLFGITLNIEPDICGFLDFKLSDSYFKGLLPHRNSLASIVKSSRIQSLRVVNKVLHDTKRLVDCLTKDILTNELGLERLISEFVIWAICVHGSIVSRENLNGITDASRLPVLQMRMEREGPNDAEVESIAQDLLDLSRTLETMFSSYQFSVDYGILNRQLVEDIFFNGKYDWCEICSLVNQSTYFTCAAKLPEWQVIFHIDRHCDEDVYDAIVRLKKVMSDNIETNPFYLLHVFMQYMYLSDYGLIPESKENVLNHCELYIKRIETNLPDETLLIERYDSYDQHKYVGRNEKYKAEFLKLRSLFKEAAVEQLDSRLTELSHEFLSMVKDSPALLNEYVHKPQIGFELYQIKPFLHLIDVDEFIPILLALEPSMQTSVAASLKRRLYSISSYDEDRLEADWIERLIDGLIKYANSETGMKKYRSNRFAEIMRTGEA